MRGEEGVGVRQGVGGKERGAIRVDILNNIKDVDQRREEGGRRIKEEKRKEGRGQQRRMSRT